MISLETARLRLARLWFIWVGIIFLLLVAQSSAGNVYEGRLEEVWSWALPTFIPTLSLLLTVLGKNAIVQVGDGNSKITILRQSFYSIAYWLSVFYLSLIMATILLHPIAVSVNPSDKYTAADFLKRSQLWLSPIQGLVISAMGTLFFSNESASSSQDTKRNK